MIVFEHPNIVILVLLVAICIMLKFFIPLYKENSELIDERRHLQKELNEIKRKYGNFRNRSNKNTEFLKSEHEREIGQVVKSEFDNIILSLPKSKIFAPNVSIEHLTSLCNVPEANERFFRALLQEFEIEHLEVNNVDGKHNITMKLRSGNKTYTTQLDDCTCRDFCKVNGHKVCKHMYFLVLTLGLISREHYEQFHECAESFPEKKLKSLMKKK